MLGLVDRVRPPDRFQDRAMRQHPPGTLREEQQQLELFRRQANLVLASHDPASIAIDDQIANQDLPLRRARRLEPPQRHPDARHQLLCPERLGHVIVGARVERLHFGALFALHRQHDDGHRGDRPNPLAQLEAVHPRHEQIRDDQLRVPLIEVRERRLAFARGLHLIPLARQHGAQHACDLRLVVHHQHA